MNCPYCGKGVEGMTGLQELVSFKKHMRTCKKNPANLPLSDGKKTAITPSDPSMEDALIIRHKSGQ